MLRISLTILQSNISFIFSIKFPIFFRRSYFQIFICSYIYQGKSDLEKVHFGWALPDIFWISPHFCRALAFSLSHFYVRILHYGLFCNLFFCSFLRIGTSLMMVAITTVFALYTSTKIWKPFPTFTVCYVSVVTKFMTCVFKFMADYSNLTIQLHRVFTIGSDVFLQFDALLNH